MQNQTPTPPKLFGPRWGGGSFGGVEDARWGGPGFPNKHPPPPPLVIPPPKWGGPSLGPKSIGNIRCRRRQRKFFFRLGWNWGGGGGGGGVTW